MYLPRRIEFQVKDDVHVVVVNPDEDAKKILRERLGVNRLPNGVKVLSNKKLPYSEFSVTELNQLLESEQKYYNSIVVFLKQYPDAGKGWYFIRDLVAKHISEIKEAIQAKEVST